MFEPTEPSLDSTPGPIPAFKPGDQLTGKVIRIRRDIIQLEFPGGVTGAVPGKVIDETPPEMIKRLEVGLPASVWVIKAPPESRRGLLVSLAPYAEPLPDAWEKARELLESGEIIELFVQGHNQGGLLVNFFGIRGFVPRSALPDLPRDLDEEALAAHLKSYVGQMLSLKVVDARRADNRLVLSNRLSHEPSERNLDEIQVGEVHRVRVVNFSSFGVFVTLGRIQTMIHKSELSWDPVDDPSTVVKIGEEFDAAVIGIDRERRRIQLSRKRMLPDPWEKTVMNYPVGDWVSGVVENIVKFGIFVRLDQNVLGLLHKSEMDPQAGNDLEGQFSRGQSILVRVKKFDLKERRISLSLKNADEPAVELPAIDEFAPEEPPDGNAGK